VISQERRDYFCNSATNDIKVEETIIVRKLWMNIVYIFSLSVISYSDLIVIVSYLSYLSIWIFHYFLNYDILWNTINEYLLLIRYRSLIVVDNLYELKLWTEFFNTRLIKCWVSHGFRETFTVFINFVTELLKFSQVYIFSINLNVFNMF
jgi:hypothetical protein